MRIDVEAEREITPGTRAVTHLNNAGSSLPTRPVLDAMHGYLMREATIGGYEMADESQAVLESVHASVAALVNASVDEVAILTSATAAWAAAFTALRFQPGDRIITGRSEYVSNALNLLVAEERHGVEIVVVDDDVDGAIDLDALRAAIDDRTVLIALTHVPTGGGLVNPAAEVGAIAREAGVLFMLDACQSVGQRPLDVDALGCDVLTATGRKFLRAPRGTGFLYVRRAALDRFRPIVLDSGAAAWTGPMTYELLGTARRFELFESNLAVRVGLGVAVEHALALGLDAIGERTTRLAEELRESLSSQPGVQVHDKGRDRCAIVTFTVDGVEAPRVKAALADRGINTSVTTVGSAQFDFPRRGLSQLVRASPHYFNTSDELGQLVDVVATLR